MGAESSTMLYVVLDEVQVCVWKCSCLSQADQPPVTDWVSIDVVVMPVWLSVSPACPHSPSYR